MFSEHYKFRWGSCQDTSSEVIFTPHHLCCPESSAAQAQSEGQHTLGAGCAQLLCGHCHRPP